MEIFSLLREVEDSLQGVSCLPKEPFMKLGQGQAPILNYNLEQKSSFPSYGHFLVNILTDYFKPNADEVPVSSVLNSSVQEMTVDQVRVELQKDLARGDSKILKTLGGQTLAAAELRSTETPVSIGNTGANIDEISAEIKSGRVPFVHRRMGGFQSVISTIKPPTLPKGKIFVIEEYTTASFLGDYGAGQTLSTFSLLPDEKTTITMRTFESSTEKKTRSENVLDSFSESSANEMENSLENENLTSNDSATSDSKTNSVSLEVSAKIKAVVDISAQASHTSSKNSTASRAANTRALGRALEKHVQNSNSNREVAINQASESTVTTETEQTIVRELVNPNKSRVLNFVFRQLLQEYITITYLSNIRIAFCNGYPESFKIVDLEDVDTLLEEFIKSTHIVSVRNEILKHYCKVFNYQNELKDFIETVTVNYGACLPGATGSETFWRIKPNLQDIYSREGGLEIKVRGVILNVQTNILRTPSVIADALLGQGEALDCFNTRLQDTAAVKAYLDNAATLQQMDAIASIDNPVEKAAAYKKVFGDCCTSDVIVPR
jgi:hypothetical protein